MCIRDSPDTDHPARPDEATSAPVQPETYRQDDYQDAYQGEGAVSYTHLDVYKRQDMRWSTPAEGTVSLHPAFSLSVDKSFAGIQRFDLTDAAETRRCV